MAGRVCVIGSANMDLVVRAPRLPLPGETLLGGPFATHPGGKGANQAVAASRMGAQVMMVGRVGPDAYGNELRSLLSREGVDLTALRTTAGSATGVALITVDESGGENTIVVAGGANRRLGAEDVRGVAGLIRSADVILGQLEVPADAIDAAIEVASASGRRMVLNAAPARTLSAESARAVDVLVVNRVEAAELSGVASGAAPPALVRGLRERGFGAIVVTLGREGAVLATDAEPVHIGAPAVRSVDSVGAGDAFCGALAAMLAERRPLEDAVRLGCAAGAQAATRAGAIPSLPRRDQVERLLTAHAEGGGRAASAQSGV